MQIVRFTSIIFSKWWIYIFRIYLSTICFPSFPHSHPYQVCSLIYMSVNNIYLNLLIYFDVDAIDLGWYMKNTASLFYKKRLFNVLSVWSRKVVDKESSPFWHLADKMPCLIALYKYCTFNTCMLIVVIYTSFMNLFSDFYHNLV